MSKDKPKILEHLKRLNSHSDKIKIRSRAKYNKDKKIIGYSVYLDLYRGQNDRELEYLDKQYHLSGLTSTIQEDKEILRRVEALRNQKQLEYINSRSDIKLKNRRHENFLNFYSKYIINNNYTSTLIQIKNFIKRDYLAFEDITPEFCDKFAEYLKTKVSSNSAFNYYATFKGVLNKAIKDSIIIRNPALYISIKRQDTKREYLTENEIIKLLNTEKTNLETCNAFLFSCFTGLRYSDIDKLKFSDIKNGYIEFRQKKTSQEERFKLSENALEIFKIQKKKKIRTEKVFDLVVRQSIRLHLRSWIKKAGIKKHITFHCARHTFATMQLSNDVDLYAVSKLLGHKDIKTTQIYAKLINKKLDEAIDKQPKFVFKSEV